MLRSLHSRFPFRMCRPRENSRRRLVLRLLRDGPLKNNYMIIFLKILKNKQKLQKNKKLPILLNIITNEDDTIKTRFGRVIRVETPPSDLKTPPKRYSLRSRSQRITPSSKAPNSIGDETDYSTLSSENTECDYHKRKERDLKVRVPTAGDDFVKYSFLLESAKKNKKREGLLDELEKKEFGRVCKLYEDLVLKVY